MEVEEQIKKWILDNVRQQKSIRERINAREMKSLVERELGVGISEAQFVTAMKQLGFTERNGYFNSILINKLKPEKDARAARDWGLSKQARKRWENAQRDRAEQLKIG